MTDIKATRELPQQIAAVEHAIAVLSADEEMQPGLIGARNTLAWTNANQDVVKSAAGLIKRKGGFDLVQRFLHLSDELPDLDEVLLAFVAMRAKHPEIVTLLNDLYGHASIVPVKQDVSDAG